MVVSRPGTVVILLAINEPAIVFTVLYGITLVWYIVKVLRAFTDATSVFFFLMLFCASELGKLDLNWKVLVD